MEDRDIRTLTNDEVNNIEYYLIEKEAGDANAFNELKFHLRLAGFSFNDDTEAIRKASLIVALWENFF